MSTETETYQGWKNYETWACALWIDNEEGTYNCAREMAREAKEAAEDEDRERSIWTDEEATRFGLADKIEEMVKDSMPDLGASLAADLLGAAVSEIDWTEVAEHYLED